MSPKTKLSGSKHIPAPHSFYMKTRERMLPDSSWVREQYAETTLYPKLFPCEVSVIAMLMASAQ